MKKILKNPVNLRDLFTEQGMDGLDFVSMDIGYDGKVYFLFSSGVPDRIDGMFVNTAANAAYTALVVTPSWENGSVEKAEKLDLGKHAMNFHFIRPVPDGSILLLGARCLYSEKNGPEKNAVFTDREGSVLRELTFGDGIADCIVRNDGVIITSYFDEGIFGNYGWEEPIGSCGLCAWTADGSMIWRSERDITDCYAINIDENGNLWYYYYTDFQLIRTDFSTETEYDPMVEGADSFAVVENGSLLIMDGGYEDSYSFHAGRIRNGRIEAPEPLEFVSEDGISVTGVSIIWGGAKALVLTGDGDICFEDFSGH